MFFLLLRLVIFGSNYILSKTPIFVNCKMTKIYPKIFGSFLVKITKRKRNGSAFLLNRFEKL